MELVETGYAERRDRRLRWIAVGTLLLLTQAVAVLVSVNEHLFDPRLFAMLAAPALGVATGILAHQYLESAMSAMRAPASAARLRHTALALAPANKENRVRARGSRE
jgi:hypothetical protein